MNVRDVYAGFYPERYVAAESAGDRMWAKATFRLQQLFHRRIVESVQFAAAVARHASNAHLRSLPELVPDLRYRLRVEPLADHLLAEAFGLYCASLHGSAIPEPRVLGAAQALVRGGAVELAESSDRQGALALASVVMALRGVPVHLLTSTPSRARTVADALRTPLGALGIDVGVITPDMSNQARHENYAKLIVCGSLRDIGFDYLRDRIVLGARPRRVLGSLDRLSGETGPDSKIFLPGMRCALVDDADYVLLDDSRTPLSVSTEAADSGERLTYEQALELARVLDAGSDFSLRDQHSALTPAGTRRVSQLAEALGGIWANRQSREELIELALDALHLTQPDHDYKVVHGRVVFSALVPSAPEEPSAAEQLLRKLVEVKEGCRLSGSRVVLAQMTVPRVLGRYLHLAGVCADARGLEYQLWRLYGLKTSRAGAFPLPVRWSARLFASAAAKRDAVIARVRAAAASHAVVIALRSPAEAQLLLEACAEARIKVGLVRGTADAADQQAIGDLETAGSVVFSIYPAERTVAREALNSVPLHLVVAELHDSERHIAHVARSYGAHSCEILVALEDDAVKNRLSPRALRAGARAAMSSGEVPSHHAVQWVRRALRNAERASAVMRHDALAVDRNLDDLLAFSGQRE
jgi:preprotein translocase subunit SecA